MKDKVILSLFDYSTNMVKPWIKSGYKAFVVDIKHEGTVKESIKTGELIKVGADIMNWLPPLEDYEMVFAFPPCTNLAVSGARWFKDKGLMGLSEGIRKVEKAREIAEWSGAEWLIENPVSTLSTYWREPDYIFHPYQYDGYTQEDNAYSKKTCLWTSKGFNMPKQDSIEEFDDRIHKMAPSKDRSEKRSKTPMGFAKAVFQANRR